MKINGYELEHRKDDGSSDFNEKKEKILHEILSFLGRQPRSEIPRRVYGRTGT